MSSAIANITAISCTCVITSKPFVSAAWTMLPGSTRRRPTRPAIGAEMRAVLQLKPRAGELSLVGLHGALKLRDERDLRIDLLLRDGVRIHQRLIAGEVAPRVVQERAIAGNLTFHLRHGGLERPRVDLGDHVTLRDERAFGDGNAHQFSVDARSHGHVVERRDRPQPGDVDGHVTNAGERGRDRRRASRRATW